MNGDVMFKFLGSCFSEDQSSQEGGKIRLKLDFEISGAKKTMRYVRIVRLDVEFYEKLAITMGTYGTLKF